MSDDVDTNAISDLISIIMVPLQEVQDVFQQLLTECDVNTGVGAQLDVIGNLVGGRIRGQRKGLSDDVYRTNIRAMVSVNKSGATINELLAIARLVILDDTVDLEFDNHGSAAYTMILVGDVDLQLATTVAAFLQRATAAGVRASVQYGISPPAEWFRFDIGPGFDVGKLTDGIG